MTDKIKIISLAALCICLMMMVSFCSGWSMRGKRIQPPTTDTIVKVRVDTVTLVEPRIDTLIRIVDRLYPVTVHDTIVKGDTLYIRLPYEHRYYALPDTLEVWYSGVDPKIDSAILYYNHTTEIIRHPYEVPKMPRVTLGVGVGAFYNEKQINPYLLGEMRYNAPKTAWQVYGGINHEGQWSAGACVIYRINLVK